jgi:hypothetical protein
MSQFIGESIRVIEELIQQYLDEIGLVIVEFCWIGRGTEFDSILHKKNKNKKIASKGQH